MSPFRFQIRMDFAHTTDSENAFQRDAAIQGGEQKVHGVPIRSKKTVDQRSVEGGETRHRAALKMLAAR